MTHLSKGVLSGNFIGGRSKWLEDDIKGRQHRKLRRQMLEKEAGIHYFTTLQAYCKKYNNKLIKGYVQYVLKNSFILK